MLYRLTRACRRKKKCSVVLSPLLSRAQPVYDVEASALRAVRPSIGRENGVLRYVSFYWREREHASRIVHSVLRVASAFPLLGSTEGNKILD